MKMTLLPIMYSGRKKLCERKHLLNVQKIYIYEKYHESL
jgi:hypothetical protein